MSARFTRVQIMMSDFRSLRTLRSLIAAAILAVGVVGCGDSGVPRQAIYGRISGAEGRSGLVSFIPQGGTQAPAARASFENGEYQFSRADGPLPGDYTVIIQLEKSQDGASGIVVFKGVELPAGTDVPPSYETVASVPVSVPQDGDSLQVDMELPES